MIFDPSSRMLMLINNSQLTIWLSNPASRLLTELIKNNGLVLTRETLVKHVWEDYGFTPSNATLSNHISELRKAFEALGVSKDILITVPRIGFKMEARIHPERIPPKEAESAEQPELPTPESDPIVVENVTVETLGVSSQKPLRRGMIPALSLLLVLLVTAAVMAWMMLRQNNQVLLIGIQDKCDIYGLDESKHESAQSGRALMMLADAGIDCTQVDRDIYYMEVRPANNRLKAQLLAACTKNRDTSYKNCTSFKRVE
jgi:DNA-binding winged helix-turn-helix (wHTH) protein